VTAPVALEVRRLTKTFTLHTQGGVALPVLRGVSLAVAPGECVALTDPSGSGKSTLLRVVYGNYRAQGGEVLVRHDGRMMDVARAEPRHVLAMRRRTVGYVSQVLRVVPRVPALDVVAEPLRALEVPAAEAAARARRMLGGLAIPERLWALSPVTFSGGEQQRVNVARTFVVDYPLLLLDEPTASLDAASRGLVMELIRQARQRGAAILATFHDADVRNAVATRLVTLAATATA
jgi:alpha-D-ribose 1-methylphosphonate 5-triphosphate synthase subunit PhnL